MPIPGELPLLAKDECLPEKAIFDFELVAKIDPPGLFSSIWKYNQLVMSIFIPSSKRSNVRSECTSKPGLNRR
jgi:hypothetical protein